MTRIRCPQCRHVQDVDADAADAHRCGGCGRGLRIPRPAPPPPPPPARPAPPPPDDDLTPYKVVKLAAPSSARTRPAPPPSPPEDDPRPIGKVEREDDEDAAEPPPRPRRRRVAADPAPEAGPGRVLPFTLGVVGWLAVWGLTAWATAADARPGSNLMDFHLLPLAAGYVWVAVLAARDPDPRWAGPVVYVPGAAYVYAAKHPGTAWRPLLLLVLSPALWLAGLVVYESALAAKAPPPADPPPPTLVGRAITDPAPPPAPKPATPPAPAPEPGPTPAPVPAPAPALPAPPAALVPGGGEVYLAGLTAFEVVDGPWPYTADGTLGDPFKKPIEVGGKKYPRGLSMHPPNDGYAVAKFRLGGRAAELRGGAALNDSAAPFTPPEFYVWGDGRLLWKSVPVKEKGEVVPVKVDVTGVDVLELRVRTDNHHGVHAVWLDPRLTPAGK